MTVPSSAVLVAELSVIGVDDSSSLMDVISVPIFSPALPLMAEDSPFSGSKDVCGQGIKERFWLAKRRVWVG